MKQTPQPPVAVRLHLTNVVGAGATQLLACLLPALERHPGTRIAAMYLPDRGALAGYHPRSELVPATVYRRRLPNVLSRILECTLLAGRFGGETPLLVLGDLPLRCRGPQTVFVQQSNLLRPRRRAWTLSALKFAISRALFRFNLGHAGQVIVQSDYMRADLVQTYPALEGRVHVVAQPVPDWLLACSMRRTGRVPAGAGPLRLFYPAAPYPHKNHALLKGLGGEAAGHWPVAELVLTLDPAAHPAPAVPWVRCVGFLDAARMIDAYGRADALLFLSREESYGFPLLEAMYLGLPIVCPDLPYARSLCGDGALYFQVDSLASLRDALQTLQDRLRSGWWPDWSQQLARYPDNWDDVATAFLQAIGRSMLSPAANSLPP